MRRFFTDKLSEANLRNVMKQATALATGAGIPHTRKSNWFRRGEPVTLDEDLVELRARQPARGIGVVRVVTHRDHVSSDLIGVVLVTKNPN